jgi:hypothetical protein
MPYIGFDAIDERHLSGLPKTAPGFLKGLS